MPEDREVPPPSSVVVGDNRVVIYDAYNKPYVRVVGFTPPRKQEPKAKKDA
jgi:hypothetical protein